MNQKKINKSLPVNDRIKFLKHCSELYESNGSSPISDTDYDNEYYELERLDPNNSFFDEVGGISDNHIYGTRVKHDVIMGSLNKSLDINSFLKWIKLTYSKVPNLILQHKIDGLSLSLLYNKGRLIRATTRGDGITGIDVTKNAIFVKGVLKEINYTSKVEIRGECFKDKFDFYKNWHTSVNSEGYKNPRNFAAGSLNQIDPNITKERELEFIAYEIVQKEFETEIKKDKFLNDCGFKTLSQSSIFIGEENKSFEDISKSVSKYMDEISRENLPYDIDGIVVKLNDITESKAMGSTSGGRKPRSNRAVKFPPEEKITTIKSIEVNVGRTGAITPVAILNPIDLGGAIITRATLHNFGALTEGDAIRIGAKVVVAKKGDIIPQIISIKENGKIPVEIPSECPSCGEKVHWDKNKVDLVCDNINCKAQLNKKIEHWFKKIGVKGIGGGTIAKLTDPDILSWDGRAIIESLPEMYYMLDNDSSTKNPELKYNRLQEFFGEKTYENIIKSIKSVKEVTLAQLIESLGIGQIGRTAQDLVSLAPSIEELDKLTSEKIISIEGFAENKANNFINGWNSIRNEIEKLLAYIEIKSEDFKSDKLQGKAFCFTGSFSNPTRKEMENLVVKNGGKVSSVSKNLTALVWDEETMKGKYEKAKTLNIDIITQEKFMDILE